MRPTRLFPIALLVFAFSTGFAHGQDARLANLSSRGYCQTGNAVLVNEFVVQGRGSGSFVTRCVGPSLPGVSDALQDPTATLLNARGQILDANNDWMQNPDKDEISATGLAPKDPREPAMIDTLAAGVYTLVAQGVSRSQGSALPEIYDLSNGTVQISAMGTRGFVSTGDHVLLSGFIITGTAPARLLFRALGPSLADAGLSPVLPNPALELYNANGTLVATNDDWRETQASEIADTGLAPRNDLESAIVVTLNPGAYTLVTRGVNGTTGLGFAQIYDLSFRTRELYPAPKIKRARAGSPNNQ